MDCILNGFQSSVKFLDYDNKINLTTSNQTFKKDGVAYIHATSTNQSSYLLINDVELTWTGWGNSYYSLVFPVKQGQRVKISGTVGIAYFIPFLD